MKQMKVNYEQIKIDINYLGNNINFFIVYDKINNIKLFSYFNHLKCSIYYFLSCFGKIDNAYLRKCFEISEIIAGL